MRTQAVSAGADVVRQGDQPDVAVTVLSGMLARYHTLESGERQYISLHIAGDMPDVQSLLLDMMDHSLCALNAAEIGLVGHEELRELFLRRPALSFAFWRLTLLDAAITRAALTNNSARPQTARVAHLLCEQYYRAREAGLAQDESCSLPMSQTQLGQALGMSLVSVNRALKRLRADGLADLRLGTLIVHDWLGLKRIAGFDPSYLHVARKAEIARTRFKGRGGD
jgi:CRP-like cAMP-binding protein